MNRRIVISSEPVTLVGGGDLGPSDLHDALSLAPRLVAADGGARAILEAGLMPEAVIGDLDSLSPESRAALAPERIHEIDEQDSTDFDKALRSVDAPLVIGVGFLGARLDHQFAALNILVRRADRLVVLISAHEIVLNLPARISLPTQPGDIVSLMPMAQAGGASEGLHWPIDGLTMAPWGQSGTSNRATGEVWLRCDAPGLVCAIPRARLEALVPVLLALEPDARWPARA